MSKIVGIDLGTTNSVVAVMEGSEVKVIPNPTGSRTTPSVVAFTETGERLVGQRAKNQAVTNPENTIYSIKRFMGRRRREVVNEEKLVPYKIVGGPDDLATVEVRGKRYTPSEISAMILQYMKQYAEDYLGQKIAEAVITVPAYFNDSQRTATKEAGEIAGFKVRRIINEPTAAALAYGLDKKKDEKIAVYDLGGGTFDVSVLEVGEGLVEVKATNGDTHLGGDDYDQVLIDYVADEFKKQHGIDVRRDRLALQRLKEAGEKCKIELSSSLSSTINLPFITQVGGQARHLQLEVTRAKFEALTKHLTERTRGPVEQALLDAKLTPSDTDEVILVGGATRTPAVQELARGIFKKDPNRSVNPDEVVAVGAAIQGAILGGEKQDILLLDVTPLTLGIETLGGVMTPMIQRNTTIPTQKKEIFSTAQDDQSAVDVKVFQGERKKADANRLLGVFRLDGIPPAPRGVPKIEVTFDIDANGILNVGAKDLATSREQKITVQGASGLSKADVERMKREAEAHAAEDQRLAEVVEAKNRADHAIYSTEKILKENPEQYGAEKQEVERLLADLKAARDAGDKDGIERGLEALTKIQHRAAEEVYKRATAGAGAAGGGSQRPSGGAEGGGSRDDVIDAEYEVKPDSGKKAA